MIDQDELIRRAKEVADDYFLPLMEDDGVYHPEDDDPFGGNARRFLLVRSTAENDDKWLDFADDTGMVADWLASRIEDDWGFEAIYDLARDDYAQRVELDYSVTVRIRQGD